MQAVDNSDNLEIPQGLRWRNARQVAIREFLFHHNVILSERQCWVWKRCTGENGYGVIVYDGFYFPVHRLSFEHYKGRIPKGFEVMHECDNRPCYNFNHLFLGTHSENMQDMVRKSQFVDTRALSKLEQERANLSWWKR